MADAAAAAKQVTTICKTKLRRAASGAESLGAGAPSVLLLWRPPAVEALISADDDAEIVCASVRIVRCRIGADHRRGRLMQLGRLGLGR